MLVCAALGVELQWKFICVSNWNAQEMRRRQIIRLAWKRADEEARSGSK